MTENNRDWLKELIRRGETQGKLTEIWDVIAALRGPDKDDTLKLKWLTTGRVRYLVGVPRSFMGLAVTPALTDEDIALRDKLLRSYEDRHFESHFRCAMMALVRLGYNVPVNEMDSLP